MPTIQLPPDTVSTTLNVANGTISNFSPLTNTIIGILLAVVMIEILIGIFRK